jgi:hypothetical protein
MSGLFEHLAASDEVEKTASRQAVAVTQKRLANQILPFLAAAPDAENRKARLSLVEGDVRQIVADVAEEYQVNPERLQEAMQEQLQGEGVTDIDAELEDAPSAVGHTPLAATKTAEADRDGGGAVKRESLPDSKNDSPTGLSDQPSPKTDHKTWKPNALNDSGNLKPIDTEQSGSPVPSEKQDVSDDPDYETDKFIDKADAVTEQQELPEADDSGQSTERNIDQPHTDNSEMMVRPTRLPPRSSPRPQDPDKNPLREILSEDPEWLPQSQVTAAINEFDTQARKDDKDE